MRHALLLSIFVVCATLSLASAITVLAQPAVPPGVPWYEKRDTWLHTMLAAQEKLARNPEQARRPVPLPDFGRDDFSLTAWIRTSTDGTILAKAPAEGPWQPQGKAWFVRAGKLCFDVGWVGVVTSARAVADGQWHHVAVTKTGNRIQFGIDGQLDAAGDLIAGPDVPLHVTKIGYTSTNFPGPAFSGLIDELRVFRGPLSPEQVRAWCVGSPPSGVQSVAAYWPFEAGGIDASGNRNHASGQQGVSYAQGRVGSALRLEGGDAHLTVASGGPSVSDGLWALLERDFPDPAAREEMAWEREDGLWGAAVVPGAWADLAGRYGKAAAIVPALGEKASSEARSAASLVDVERVRTVYLTARRYRALQTTLAEANLTGLRQAIEYLRQEYEGRYQRAPEFLTRLARIETKVTSLSLGMPTPDLERLVAEILLEIPALQREALLSGSPAVACDRLVFVKRYTYQANHYYTAYINGCQNFGGNLCVLSLKDGKVAELCPRLAGGIFGRFSLSFDGKTIVFDYKRKIGEGFRIWEVGVDGTGLRQITFPPPDEAQRIATYKIDEMYQHHTDDMQPCYLPDGGICFISTRCEFGILCDPPDLFTTTVLYRMNRDGSGLTKLTNSSVSEASPAVMNDGRILYTRWEYVDKGAVCIKCLWAMRPDGTQSCEVYKNDIALPPTFIHGLPVPGSNHLFVVSGTPHCPQGTVGTVIRVDTNQPLRTRAPMTYLTPTVDIRAEGGFCHERDGQWGWDDRGPLYADPFPLSAAFCLVSCNPDRVWNDTKAYGVCLLDQFGNRVPVYRDPDISCWQPVPLRPRPTPPVLPSLLPPGDTAPQAATVFLSCVYRGLSGVTPGTIKYLRIMEQVPRPWSARRRWDGDCYDQQHAVITKDTHLGLKVLRGIVPVEDDGSAYFTVPSDRNLFFQALDRDFMEVQRMRTYVNYRPGEQRSCVGCHAQQEQAAPAGYAAALRRPPSTLVQQPGETAPRPIYYPVDVQPVLDRHCITCHGGARPAADLDLSGEMTELFSRSYEAILAHQLLPVIGENHPKVGNAEPVPPMTLGSHASKLIATVVAGHHGVKLSREELIKLATWVDSNAQYYGSYFGRRNIRYRGRPDFRPIPSIESALGMPPQTQ